MWTPKAVVTHVHEIKLPAKEDLEPAVDQFKELLKTVGITLAIGVPAAILFGVAANTFGDYLNYRLTN